MKFFIQSIYTSFLNKKIFEWIRLIGITGITQVGVQVIGFLSGILIIRFLPLEEYAFYILANTMLGTITLIADGGISASVMSQGGSVWQDKRKLGAIVATGLDLRKKFAIGSLALSLPILAYLLLQNGASWLMVVLIILTLIPAFYAELSDSLLDIVPKLHQNIPALQKNQGLVSVGRLFMTISMVSLLPFTFTALIASGLPRIYGNIKLQKIAEPYIIKEKPDKKVRKKIMSTVKRIMPGAVYYCLSGQITIWILSILGNTNGLAQLGALGKFAVALSIISTIVSYLIIPRYARQRELKAVLFKYYVQILVTVLIVLSAAILIIYIFPNQFLWILGDSYADLEIELFYTMIGSGIGILSGVAVMLNMSRNWIVKPILSISISIISVLVGVAIFEVTELQGVLLLNIFLAMVQLCIHGSYGLFRIRKLSMV